jgi:hypothetical protein
MMSWRKLTKASAMPLMIEKKTAHAAAMASPP